MTLSSLVRCSVAGCLLAVWVSVAGALSGCALEVFQDSISTRVEVPAQRSTEMVTATKRFRFERDVNQANSAVVYRAWVAVESPDVVDLSFISSVDVYVVHPDGSRVLAVSGVGFAPGERRRDLEIVFTDDVREFVTDERRVTLEWELQPNVLYRTDPQTETVGLRFGIVLEIDT